MRAVKISDIGSETQTFGNEKKVRVQGYGYLRTTGLEGSVRLKPSDYIENSITLSCFKVFKC